MLTSSQQRLLRRIGDLIRERMEDSELSHRKLRDRGVPRNTVWRLLQGRTDVHVSTLVAAAEALGCEVVINFRVKKEDDPHGK